MVAVEFKRAEFGPPTVPSVYAVALEPRVPRPPQGFWLADAPLYPDQVACECGREALLFEACHDGWAIPVLTVPADLITQRRFYGPGILCWKCDRERRAAAMTGIIPTREEVIHMADQDQDAPPADAPPADAPPADAPPTDAPADAPPTDAPADAKV